MRLVTFALTAGAAWRTGLRTADGIVDLLAVHAAAPVADWAPTPAAIQERGIEALATLAALLRARLVRARRHRWMPRR